MKKRLTILLPALLLVIALACGCAGASKNASYDTAASYAYETAAEPPAEAPMAMEEAAVYDAAGVTTAGRGNTVEADIPSDRKIIETAYLSVQTLEFDKFLENLNAAVAEYGGYVESSDVGGRSYYNEKQLRYANIVLRIPNDKLTAFRQLVSDIGNVTNTSSYTEDVTLSYVDTESRLAAYRVEQETLMSLLEKAESIEDILAIQMQLTQVRAEIESYESIIRTYDNRINYSTVTVNLSEVERETAVETETAGQEIARRFRESLEDVGNGFRDFGVWFVGNLPVILVWVIILGGIAVVIVLICRGGKKRRAKRAEKRAKRAAKRAEEAAKKVAKESAPAEGTEKKE